MGMREEFNTFKVVFCLPKFLTKALVTVSGSGGTVSGTGKTEVLAVLCHSVLALEESLYDPLAFTLLSCPFSTLLSFYGIFAPGFLSCIYVSLQDCCWLIPVQK